VHDVTTGIPHATGTVDAIYSSHMLEHLDPDRARYVLGECHRVLREGGTLRLVVPDLEVIARAYLEGDREKLASSAPELADAFLESLGLRKARDPSRFLRASRHLLRAGAGGHRWMYDTESLLMRLEEAGFADARRVPFREGQDHAVAQLDSRSSFHLHVEACKRGG
jgi:SAM-dependent methyltransferase